MLKEVLHSIWSAGVVRGGFASFAAEVGTSGDAAAASTASAIKAVATRSFDMQFIEHICVDVMVMHGDPASLEVNAVVPAGNALHAHCEHGAIVVQTLRAVDEVRPEPLYVDAFHLTDRTLHVAWRRSFPASQGRRVPEATKAHMVRWTFEEFCFNCFHIQLVFTINVEAIAYK